MSNLGKKVVSLIIVLFCLNYLLFGQEQIRFEHIFLEHGLSQSSAYCITQDEKGFLWTGTLDGLNKFDGYDFEVYRNNPDNKNSLPDNLILDICADNAGNLWIGTSNGLSKFNLRKQEFTNYFYDPQIKNTISNNIIRSLLFIPPNQLWIGTERGLNLFNTLNGQITTFLSISYNNQTINDDKIWQISKGKGDYLWIATGKGYFKITLDKKEISRFYIPKISNNEFENEEANNIRTIAEDYENNLWLGSNSSGLFYYNKQKQTYKQFCIEPDNPKCISSNKIRKIFSDKTGNIWIATYYGLNLYKPEIDGFANYFSNLYDPFSISNNKVISIFEDNQGLLWIGTYGGGINKVIREANKFKIYQNRPFVKNSINSNVVLSLAEDVNSNIYVGTDKGLNYVDRRNNKITQITYQERLRQKNIDNVVYAILADSKKNIWFGTAESYLIRWQPNTNNFFHTQLINKDYNQQWHFGIRAIYEDKAGNMWIGSYSGLYKYNPQTNKFTNYQYNPNEPNSLSSNIVWCIYEDYEGELWIGTDGGGLNKFDANKEIFQSYVHDYDDTTSISNNVVRSICEDNLRNLWIGTSYGLNKYNRISGKFTRFNTKNGLPNNIIYAVVPDREFLWLSTNYGICKFHTTQYTTKNYDNGHGLQSNEFNQGAALKTKDNEIFFGGINGMNSFYPFQIKDNNYIPKMVIENFYTQNKLVDISKDNTILKEHVSYLDKIKIPHHKNTFSFLFTSLHYLNPEKNLYSYCLENFDTYWSTPATRRYITYTNVPPGNYIFKVKGSNSDGVWNEQGASIEIIITPPFYRTRWFYFLATLLAFTLIIVFIKRREYNLKMEKIRLAAKVAKRTEELEKQKEFIIYQRDAMEKLNVDLQQQNEEIEAQRDLIEEKSHQLTDSIIYAQRIQQALLPSLDLINTIFPESFILYKPKAIVSGDFYWIIPKLNKIYFAVGDCTGHGVPGAFLSIVANNLLNEAINILHISKPGEILNFLNTDLNRKLYTKENLVLKEGMDIALCCYEPDTMKLEYAGAISPLYIIRNQNLMEYKANAQTIIVTLNREQIEYQFTNHSIQLEKGDMLYIFSDGFSDQFGGGTNRRKYLRKRFKNALLEISTLSMQQQGKRLDLKYVNWKGNYEQIDDVLVFGVKV